MIENGNDKKEKIHIHRFVRKWVLLTKSEQGHKALDLVGLWALSGVALLRERGGF